MKARMLGIVDGLLYLLVFGTLVVLAGCRCCR